MLNPWTILFSLCMLCLGHSLYSFNRIPYYCYADDTQLYISVNPTTLVTSPALVNAPLPLITRWIQISSISILVFSPVNFSKEVRWPIKSSAKNLDLNFMSFEMNFFTSRNIEKNQTLTVMQIFLFPTWIIVTHFVCAYLTPPQPISRKKITYYIYSIPFTGFQWNSESTLFCYYHKMLYMNRLLLIYMYQSHWDLIAAASLTDPLTRVSLTL